MSPGRLRLLVVGTLPPPAGGCTVTLQHLVDALRRRPDVDLRVVDTRGIRGAGLRGALRLAGAFGALAREARRADVVTVHLATTAVPTWGLVVAAVARLAGKPFVLRKFADTDYRRLGAIRGRVAGLVAARADAYLAETRRHLEEARARGLSRARWFPTARPVPAATRVAARPAGGARRFVYLGEVSRLKGLDVLLDAMRSVGGDVTLDVFGALAGDLSAGAFAAVPGVTFHGAVEPSSVPGVLARHDVLVLPTTATTEGYPGTILEAYLAGLPVIASRAGAIPEIVDERSGVLVPPGDRAALAAAMRHLASDAAAFAALRDEARTRARAFDAAAWADTLVSWCAGLAERRRRS